MPKSTFLDNSLLDLVLGATAYSIPGTIYVALFTTLPIPAGTGGAEVPTGGGTSYARVSLANNNTNFPASIAGTKQNGTTITFPTATANWGTIVGFGLYDAATSGNLLYFGNLQVQKPINNGDTLSVALGNLTINES